MVTEERSVLDWFEEGREARLCSQAREDNPYPPGEEGHDAWNRGWDAADEPDAREQGYR